MKALPLFPYDCCVTRNVRVDSQYRVVFETNRYSVPPDLVRRQVEMKVYSDKLLFMYDGKLMAEHARVYEKHRDGVKDEHDKALIAKRHLMKRKRLFEKFYSMGDIGEKYEKGLNAKRIDPKRHIRGIMGLVDRYGLEEVKKAMEDSCEVEIFNNDGIVTSAILARVLHHCEPVIIEGPSYRMKDKIK